MYTCAVILFGSLLCTRACLRIAQMQTGNHLDEELCIKRGLQEVAIAQHTVRGSESKHMRVHRHALSHLLALRSAALDGLGVCEIKTRQRHIS